MPDLTHEVFNQPEPLVGYNLFEGNRALRDALKLNAPRLETAELSALGATLGTAEMQTHARLANVHTPQLRSHDRMSIQRLKDKLGNKANASSEVEFHGATAWLVGEPRRGVSQILEMGTMTRMDCALGTSGESRLAGNWGYAFGTLGAGTDFDAIITRAMPR